MRSKADMIREGAYHLWEREGRPEGRELDHWLQAEANVGIATKEPGETAPVAGAKSAKRASVRKAATTTAKRAGGTKAEAKAKTKPKARTEAKAKTEAKKVKKVVKRARKQEKEKK